MSELSDRPMSRGATLSDQIEKAYGRIGVTNAHRHIAIMILLGVFFDAVEQNAIGITGPVLSEAWGLGAAQIGFLNTITFTAVALGRVATGLIIDKFGRRQMLMINLLVFTVGSLLCAIAPGYAVLALGRFIVGFGLGGEIAVAVTMMAEFFAARHRGTAVGLINVTAAGLGNMLAPLFGILVYALFDGPDRWRWVFGLLLVPAILVIFFRRYVPETPRYLAATGNVEEANVVINRLAAGRLRGPISNPVTFLESGALHIDESAPRGSLSGIFGDNRLLKRTIALGVAVCMSYAAQISMLTLMPTILVERGYTLNISLWFTLIMQSGSLIGAITAALLARRFRRKMVITAGATIGFTAALCFAFLGTTVPTILLFGALFNFSVIINNTSIWLFAPELYPTRVRGLGTSIILALGSLSGGLFPLIAGAVFDISGLTGMFVLLSGLFAILAVAIQFPPETFGKPMEEDD